MRKQLSALLLTAMVLLCHVPAISHPQPLPDHPRQVPLISYTWYTDAEMTIEAGSTASIGTEVTRLQNLYPGYTFSSTYYAGLHEFEYGYYSAFITATIYSDKY